MPSGNYELWINDDLQRSFNDRAEAIRNAQSAYDNDPKAKIQLWDLTHRRIGNLRTGERIMDPQLMQWRRQTGLRSISGHWKPRYEGKRY